MHESTNQVPLESPKLEDEVTVLMELDLLRTEALLKIRKGQDALTDILLHDTNAPGGKSLDPWVSPTEEPCDFIQPSLALLALSKSPSPVDRPLGKSTVKPVVQRLLEELHKLSISDIVADVDRRVPGYRRLKVPVLQATRSLQALLTIPGQAFSKTAVLCYYAIVLELYTITPPAWTAGSSRATPGVRDTAFMTSECTRAIAGLAKALDHTAETIESVCDLSERLDDLEGNEALPPAWREVEIRRLAIRHTNTLRARWNVSAIDLSRADVASILPPAKGVRRHLRAFSALLAEEARKALENIKLAEGEIALLSLEGSPSTGDLSFARRRASEALAKALETATEILRDLESSAPSLRSVASRLRGQAAATRYLIRPARRFLESVLNRELAAESAHDGSIWSAAELVFAAAAFASLEKPRHDARLKKATLLLTAAISPRGEFPTTTAIDLDEAGYSLPLVWSETLRAFAQLLERVQMPLAPELVQRMLARFAAIEVPSRDDPGVIGWSHDEPRHPPRAHRWTSAIAILALDRITRLLDSHINARVFRHFSVRSPSELGSLSLDKLFYPDYGMAAEASLNFRRPPYEGESVAFFLERMRSHVLRLPPPHGYRDHCHSMVLYGPPGTGKSTLLEALAVSCGCPLVEVTPSDIVLAGQSNVERRARAVFRALSLLTNAVISFDEFDQILRARAHARPDNAINEFYFLTPSMLPKLKRLNNRAADQGVAFALMTNLVYDIDQAAIRSGRFDYKVGIYPADCLSRAGRLADALRESKDLGAPAKVRDELVREPPTEASERAATVVKLSRDGGMTTLARPGNFTRPLGGNGMPHYCAMAYVNKSGEFAMGGEAAEWHPGVPDADCELLKELAKDKSVLGNQYGLRMIKEWSWIRDADQRLENENARTWSDVLGLVGPST
ncbi:MAG: AAA family ATPase [Planctomycetes bacterium]|nr:AAA family ATPase [Planctomycetota bacterium]